MVAVVVAIGVGVAVVVGVGVGMTEDLVSLLLYPARFAHAIVKRGEAKSLGIRKAGWPKSKWKRKINGETVLR